MARQFDLGRDAVASIKERLRIDADRCVDGSRDFVWFAPSTRSQRVWAEAPGVDGATLTWRVHVRTGVLAGSGDLSATPALPLATLGALVRDRENANLLQLAASVDVHAGNLAWAPDLLASAARVQMAEAEWLAHSPELQPAGSATTERHDGGRAVFAAVAAPVDEGRQGRAPAAPVRRWGRADVAECVDALALSQPFVRFVDTPRGTTATFSHGDGLMACAITMASRPDAGDGLLVVLTVSGLEDLPCPMVLNERELDTRSGTDLLGSWSVRDGALEHHSFFPDAVHHPGLAREVARGSARRARWITGFASWQASHLEVPLLRPRGRRRP